MNPAQLSPRWLKHSFAIIVFALALQISAGASSISFKIILPANQPQPLTGRVFVIIARAGEPDPRLQVGSLRSRTEMIAMDTPGVAPGQAVTLNALAPGYPLKSVRELPAGDYYVQALFNVYTRFQRSDGNTIWGHMDQWDGQQFNKSPGNLYTEIGHFHLDPLTGYEIRLTLNHKIAEQLPPGDTTYVKHIKIQSKLLTQFWGQPIYLGATILLPEGYDTHPNAHYPVVYEQSHFSLRAPLGFSTEESRADAPPRGGTHLRGRALQPLDGCGLSSNDRCDVPAPNGLF